jgi:E3 ubiquitin-protein ligase TRIP12
MLQYLDFHDMNDQQTALQAAANCCRSISAEHFDKVREVMPIIRGVLGWSTQKQVDPAALIFIRILDSYRSRPDLLERLLDPETVKVVNALFLPGSGSSLLKTSTYTSLLRSIMASAKASPKVANTLFEADVATSMYFILTGLLPPLVQDGDDADVSSHLPEGVVAQNLAQNPKEQIEEALTLICELLPPLPKGELGFTLAYERRLAADKFHRWRI